MAVAPPGVRGDTVLGYIRVLSAFVAPFLIVGFVVLYGFPGHTRQLWAWPIRPTMTAMVLGSAYLGGAYFFVRVLRERRWHVVAPGFLAVALFAALLGAATVVHWDRFNHQHVAFWLWAGLYFTTPFLVFGGWLVNHRLAVAPRPRERRLGVVPRVVVALVGFLALVQGVVMFVVPAAVIPIWPWTLTPLTCRVLGAVFCLGSASLVVVVDPRWTTLELMLQVETIMVVLMLVAGLRAHAEFDTGNGLTWLMLAGFGAVLAGSAVLWFSMTVRTRHVPA
jgi:hypothetical protein